MSGLASAGRSGAVLPLTLLRVSTRAARWPRLGVLLELWSIGFAGDAGSGGRGGTMLLFILTLLLLLLLPLLEEGLPCLLDCFC